MPCCSPYPFDVHLRVEHRPQAHPRMRLAPSRPLRVGSTPVVEWRKGCIGARVGGSAHRRVFVPDSHVRSGAPPAGALTHASGGVTARVRAGSTSAGERLRTQVQPSGCRPWRRVTCRGVLRWWSAARACTCARVAAASQRVPAGSRVGVRFGGGVPHARAPAHAWPQPSQPVPYRGSPRCWTTAHLRIRARVHGALGNRSQRGRQLARVNLGGRVPHARALAHAGGAVVAGRVRQCTSVVECRTRVHLRTLAARSWPVGCANAPRWWSVARGCTCARWRRGRGRSGAPMHLGGGVPHAVHLPTLAARSWPVGCANALQWHVFRRRAGPSPRGSSRAASRRRWWVMGVLVGWWSTAWRTRRG